MRIRDDLYGKQRETRECSPTTPDPGRTTATGAGYEQRASCPADYFAAATAASPDDPPFAYKAYAPAVI